MAEDDLEAYMSQCDAPAGIYDFEVKADIFSDPQKFKQYLAQAKKPATAKSVMQCLLNPEQRSTLLSTAMSPSKMMSAVMIFAKPETCTAWAAASMNPETYTSFAEFMNPMSFMQWMSGMMNVSVYQPALSELKQVH